MNLDALSLAHRLVASWAGPGDTVVDATIGNGHDTAFLAALVGEGGRVIGFDIQEAAIRATADRLAAAGLKAELYLESHAEMAARVPTGIAAAMFNLGYLPGSDKGVITRTDETLRALDAAASLLRAGGGITVVCYPGHTGGGEEANAVIAWAESQPRERFRTMSFRGLNAPATAPFLVALHRLPERVRRP